MRQYADAILFFFSDKVIISSPGTYETFESLSFIHFNFYTNVFQLQTNVRWFPPDGHPSLTRTAWRLYLFPSISWHVACSLDVNNWSCSLYETYSSFSLPIIARNTSIDDCTCFSDTPFILNKSDEDPAASSSFFSYSSSCWEEGFLVRVYIPEPFVGTLVLLIDCDCQGIAISVRKMLLSSGSRKTWDNCISLVHWQFDGCTLRWSDLNPLCSWTKRSFSLLIFRMTSPARMKADLSDSIYRSDVLSVSKSERSWAFSTWDVLQL